MVEFLIIALVVTIVIIYQLNDKNEDNKVIKSNYSWKEDIRNFRISIEYLESEEEGLIKKGETEKLNRNIERIKSYRKEISKLQECIYNNEQYLKRKGRI